MSLLSPEKFFQYRQVVEIDFEIDFSVPKSGTVISELVMDSAGTSGELSVFVCFTHLSIYLTLSRRFGHSV